MVPMVGRSVELLGHNNRTVIDEDAGAEENVNAHDDAKSTWRGVLVMWL